MRLLEIYCNSIKFSNFLYFLKRLPDFIIAAQLLDDVAPLPKEEPEKEEPVKPAAMQDAAAAAAGLLTQLEDLSCRLTPSELGRLSAQQLVQLHHRLGDMMRNVVTQLHSHVCQSQSEP